MSTGTSDSALFDRVISVAPQSCTLCCLLPPRLHRTSMRSSLALACLCLAVLLATLLPVQGIQFILKHGEETCLRSARHAGQTRRDERRE